jgi:hypothetical protein
MRIRVDGDCDSARAIRGLIGITGVLVNSPDVYHSRLVVNTAPGGSILFDSVDSDLEQAVFRQVRKSTQVPVLVDTLNGNRSDRELHITLPTGLSPKFYESVERAIVRGLCFMQTEAEKVLPAPISPLPWWKRIFNKP